jgi:hypothetical protein
VWLLAGPRVDVEGDRVLRQLPDILLQVRDAGPSRPPAHKSGHYRSVHTTRSPRRRGWANERGGIERAKDAERRHDWLVNGPVRMSSSTVLEIVVIKEGHRLLVHRQRVAAPFPKPEITGVRRVVLEIGHGLRAGDSGQVDEPRRIGADQSLFQLHLHREGLPQHVQPQVGAQAGGELLAIVLQDGEVQCSWILVHDGV